MMKNKEELLLLLEKCKQIQSSINKKIPLATNRYEQFEQIKRSEIEEFIEAKRLQALINHEEPLEACFYELEFFELHDEKEKAHNEEIEKKWLDFFVLNEITQLFADFLVEIKVASPQELTEEQKNEFKKRALKCSQIFCDKLTRVYRVLGRGNGIDKEQMDGYLQSHMEEYIALLIQGGKLSIEDKELSYRFKKDRELSEHRHAFAANFSRESTFLVTQMVTPKVAELIEKKHIFARGVYFDRPEVDVGYCDEFTSITLKRLYKEILVKEDTIIEKIGVSYVDDEGNPTDQGGHTFLAINRDPDSPLHEISKWNGILLDPWNKIACLTDEFHSLPYYYISYPDRARWESIKFTIDDYNIQSSVTDASTYFRMTGNDTEEKRVPLLIEEYQLLSLEESGLEATKKYLYDLLETVRPENCKGRIEVFITTRGAKLVDTLAGFSEPKIIIHSDFLKHMQNGVYTVEELKFALANALLYIKHEGVGIYHTIPSEEQFQLDRLSIKCCHNALAAISYLRKSINFEAVNKQDLSEVHFPDLIVNSRQGLPADFATRIKSVMTFNALKKQEGEEKAQTSLPDSVLQEVAPINRRFFFKEECDALAGTVEKLNYLKSKLSDVTVELLPYEQISEIGIRVRDFCQILNGMPIDLNDPIQLIAANQLIDRACELRIPAFERIYVALIHQTFDQNGRLNRDVFVPPLGFFKVIEDTIVAFIEAEDLKEAKQAAEKLKALRETYTNHLFYYYRYNADRYSRQFIADNNRPPIGLERFFGSCIGAYIRWSNFQQKNDQNNDEVPWAEHLKWAQEDESHIIADTLWGFGINNDRRLWSVFKPRELLGYAKVEKNFLYSKLPEALKKYSTYNYIDDILNFLSEEQLEPFNLRLEMFFSELSFEEQFKLFYDLNWAALICPKKERNTDNEAIHFLMSEFSKIAKDGTPEEQAVVKGFFLGREDKRDLTHLFNPEELSYNSSLNYKSSYVSIFLKQEFARTKFDLFTTQEQIKLINNALNGDEIPAQDFIQVFRLPFTSLSIECVERLIPLLDESEIWSKDYFKNEMFLAHLSEHGTYSLFTPEAVQFIRLVTKSLVNPADKKKILAQVRRDIPQEVTATHSLSVDDLIMLYRALDTHLIFSSIEEQECFGKLVLERISALTDCDERIRALQTLLFVENKLTLPLSNIPLRNKTIDLLIKDVCAKYGKDDKTQIYEQQMLQLIDHLYKNAAKRDAILILSRLADAIESQWPITEHLGVLLNPENYLGAGEKSRSPALGNLAAASKWLSEDKKDVTAFLDFISSPITQETTDAFATYLLTHNKINAFAESLGYAKDMKEFEEHHPGSTVMMLRTVYAQFWDLKLEERAVLIDHLLIPAHAVRTPEEVEHAYEEGFLYVSQKLFPHVGTDKEDEFALALLKAYLDTADPYIRPLLLAGMLVATNEVSRSGAKPTVGKKIAVLCEHMGPAYIKLAQAVHSHPDTPEHIRRDLDHIKGRANPPHRWQLWLMVNQVLSSTELKNIEHIGSLLGSASYNLALEVELKNRQQVVLLMLRENAAKDATQGFDHLEATLKACAHPTIEPIRESMVSIIAEARTLSTIEMNKELSEQQNKTAGKKYKVSVTVRVDGGEREIKMNPSGLITNGEGYRFIERVYGTEFNELPNQTKEDKATRKAIAMAVITVECINIFSGGCFDSDRHGNQLRYQDNVLGLYDFGEMSLEPLSEVELRQLGEVLSAVPKATVRNALFNTHFDTLLSEHINKALTAGESTRNLMRVRKAFLALRDFQKELSNEELFSVLKDVDKSGFIHQQIQTQFSGCIRTLGHLGEIYHDSKQMHEGLRFFANKVKSIFQQKSQVSLHETNDKAMLIGK